MQPQESIPNPYDWINPVHNRKLFAGRKEELSKIMDELIRVKGEESITPIVTITGVRRIGKTSLLLRIEEKCKDHLLKSIIIPIEEGCLQNSWEFWDEIFSGLLLSAQKEGADISVKKVGTMGFTSEQNKSKSSHPHDIDDLLFPSACKLYLSGARTELRTYIIQNDIDIIIKLFQGLGYEGLILIFDEAHYLLSSSIIKQQLRNIIQRTNHCGVVFAGETTLAHMFTDSSEPFFGQTNVIALENFIKMDDIAEGCMLPLTIDQAKLMSPVTIQYIARLSRGKPNQIRLICYSIFKRYSDGEQNDLNITVNVLDDILQNIAEAYRDPKLIDKITNIRRLSSVELELLYNMTRYPNWSIQDILDLDESFRGDSKTNDAILRRKHFLQKKHKFFVEEGLMKDSEEKYELDGGEFVSLYLRFFYETRRYGKLTKERIFAKGPPTPFGETSEKLVKLLAFHFGQKPELQTFIFHNEHRDFGDILDEIKNRFSALEKLKYGEKPNGTFSNEVISECFHICELIGKERPYLLICLSVRNRDNPLELIQVELYFDLHKQYKYDLESIFNLLNQQAEEARVLIEGYNSFWVELMNLKALLNSIGLVFEDLLKELPLLHQWRLSSVQHIISEQEKMADTRNDEIHDKKENRMEKWGKLYGQGKEEEAEICVLEKLQETEERVKRARLYNDLGYIRCGDKLENYGQGRKDLETALDLHYSDLQLSLLNIAHLSLVDGKYDEAIERIEMALVLTLSPIQSDVAYLRFILPENHLGFKINNEQHPANIIEVAYINLAYIILKTQGYQEALKVIEEGIELFSSSISLKHAKARYFVHKKRADLARPIYDEISKLAPLPKYIQFETKFFERHMRKRKKKKVRKK